MSVKNYLNQDKLHESSKTWLFNKTFKQFSYILFMVIQSSKYHNIHIDA